MNSFSLKYLLALFFLFFNFYFDICMVSILNFIKVQYFRTDSLSLAPRKL